MPDFDDTLSLPPTLQAVPMALEWIEALAEHHDWAPRTTFGLTLCVDEALTNVVSYAFVEPAPTPTPSVSLSYRIGENTLTLELRDNGHPYDPTAGDPPALVACLDEAEIGGHGVRLMHHYLDALCYRREADWNCLTMVMKTV